MVIIKDGVSVSRKDRSRPILTLPSQSSGSKSAQLGGIEQTSDSLKIVENQSPVERFEANLWAERNAWDIKRRSLPEDAEDWLRGGGFAGRGKISPKDADVYLTQGFKALSRDSGKPNALARRQKGGAA